MAAHAHPRVARQTVHIKHRARWRAKHQVDYALQYVERAGIPGFRTVPPSSPRRKQLLENYVLNPHNYGKRVATSFPADLKGRLAQLKTGAITVEPFLVLRKYFPRHWNDWRYGGTFDDASYEAVRRRLTTTEWYVADRYVDVMSTALLSSLDVRHQSKSPDGQHLSRDYFTTPCAIIDQFSADEDLPRRFRQAVPELALIDDPASKAGKRTARFVVYACIENPTQDPIWILPAQDVINALGNETKAQLRDSLFEFFDNWEQDLSARAVKIAQKILGGPKDEWLSFDANRFNWDYEHTKPEGHRAVGELRAHIRDLAKANAIPVYLKRGDALIIDNYRALIRRTEPRYKWIKPRMWFNRPPIRWIRMYSGFPLTEAENPLEIKKRGWFANVPAGDA
jgi:hypothetical protein